MITGDTIKIENNITLLQKISLYLVFAKFRLAALVVLSAIFTYLIGSKDEVNWYGLISLIFGGFFITGAANGLNQIFEKDVDALMNRTKDRPLPTFRMSMAESYAVSIIFTLLGTLCLWFGNNPQSAILSLVSLITYAFVYTPLKRKSSISVFVGAFPGAMPPLLGYLAATGYIGFEAILLFTLQFIWQFPHFWSIAWRLDEDYKKAGFFMMPIKNGSDKSNAFVILFYTLILIPLGFLPYYFGFVNFISTLIITIVTLYFSFTALLLYQKCDIQSATKLMFASFIYLPVMQMAWFINI